LNEPYENNEPYKNNENNDLNIFFLTNHQEVVFLSDLITKYQEVGIQSKFLK